MNRSLKSSTSALALATNLLVSANTYSMEHKSDGVTTDALSATDRSAIEYSVTKQLKSQARTTEKLPGQLNFDVSAHLSAKESKLVIELGNDALPESAGADSEDQCSQFATTARYLNRPGFRGGSNL